MAEENRIWAGHSTSESGFAISIGTMEDDPQRSKVAMYADGQWTVTPLDITVMSLTSAERQNGEGAVYVALGIDGDVIFFDRQPVRENIAGSGVQDDGSGLGSLLKIRNVDGNLIASGIQSQIYRRRAAGDWERLCDKDAQEDVGENNFSGLGLRPGDAFAACGYSGARRRVPTPEEQAELDKLENGPIKEYLQKSREYKRVTRSPGGCLYFRRDTRWFSATLPTSQHLNDLIEFAGGFVAVGNGGTILRGSSPDDIEDVSPPDLKERLWAVRRNSRNLYVLGESSIFVFDNDLRQIGAILLPDELSSSNTLDVVENAIWYFDHKGVAKYTDQTWKIIDIPPQFWR